MTSTTVSPAPRWHDRFGAAAATLFIALLVMGATAGRASAHAAYDQSVPAPNAVIETAPPVVTIRFTEPLEETYTQAKLFDHTGVDVPGTSFRISDRDQHTLILALPASLPNGTYTVAWQNLSAADGHRLQGYFAFTVGTAADVGAAAGVTLDDGNVPFWLGGVARWTALLGIALIIAILPMWLFVLSPALTASPDSGVAVGRRTQRLAYAAVPFAIGANFLALVVQSAGNAGDEGLLSILRSTTFDTRYGQFWLIRLGLILLLGAVFPLLSWTSQREHPLLVAFGLCTAIALPFPVSMLAHASAQVESRSVAIAADYFHLLGAAIWGGGLFVLAITLIPALRGAEPTTRRVVIARVVPRFSMLGLAAWATLALTGTYMAYLQVGSIDGLRDTAYGDSLLLKLLVLSPTLLLAAANLLVLGPRLRLPSSDLANRAAGHLRWAIMAEAALVIVALFFVGRLIGQEPAREVIAARQPTGTTLDVALVTQAETRPSELTISPNLPGPNTYRLEVGGTALPDGTDGVLRLEPAGNAIGQKEVTLTRVEATNTFTGTGTELALPGDWSMEVIVRKPGTLEGRQTLPHTIGGTTIGEERPDFWRIDWPGLVGLSFVVGGVACVAIAWLFRSTTWRRQGAIGGGFGVAVGVLLIYGALISPTDAESDVANMAGSGTPVARDGIAVSLIPDFGALGQNTVTITVTDDGGAPIDDAAVSIDGDMPEMGMSLTPMAATALGSGQYQITAVPITMGGDWYFDVTVDRADEDPVTIPFIVPIGE